MNATTFISELEFEFVSTEKLLRRIPTDKLSWQPHPKARPLGELALHVAAIPAKYLQYAKDGYTPLNVLVARRTTTTIEEILATFQQSRDRALEILENEFNSMAENTWNLTHDGNTVFSLPLPVFTRLLVINHLVHHRGELVMYLRTLDVLIPSIYGPSADENPFL